MCLGVGRRLEATIKEVVCIISSGGGSFRLLLCLIQLVVALIVAYNYLRRDTLQEYAANMLRFTNYRTHYKSVGVVRSFSGEVNTVLMRKGTRCVWFSQNDELLTLLGCCPEWQVGDKFSFAWVDVPSAPATDGRYVIEVVRVLLFPMNVYYFVLRDQEGRYAGSLRVVWHS